MSRVRYTSLMGLHRVTETDRIPTHVSTGSNADRITCGVRSQDACASERLKYEQQPNGEQQDENKIIAAWHTGYGDRSAHGDHDDRPVRGEPPPDRRGRQLLENHRQHRRSQV